MIGNAMKRRRQHCMNLWTISISSIALYERARSMGYPNGAYHSFAGAFQSRRLVSSRLGRVQTFHLSSTLPSEDTASTHSEEAIQDLAGDEALSSRSSSTSTSSSGPLSLAIDELSSALGGKIGRARAAWDCYRIGVDPVLFYDPKVEESDIDASVWRALGCCADEIRSASPDVDVEFPWTTPREETRHLLPARRRTQGLGGPAVKLLADIGPKCKCAEFRGIETSLGTISAISQARDGTTKLLVRLAADGLEVETVIIPWEDTGKSTLCLSSQVGCRQGCVFCATGKMGRLRSLSSDEILLQVFLAAKVCRVLGVHAIDGVVYMGMGDAADNGANVIRSANILTDGELFSFAKTRCTISTVGPSPEAFAVLGQAPAALAWSVHSSRDDLRKKLVPTTQYTMKDLRRGYLDALLARPRKLRVSMLEIALIREINDAVEDADHLGDFVLEMLDEVPDLKVMVNLIPFNDIDGMSSFRKPPMDRIKVFQDRLASKGIKSCIRTTRGDDESAACGQLVTNKKKKNEQAEV